MLFNIIEFTMMRGVANSITGLVSNQIALNGLQSGCNVRSHPVLFCIPPWLLQICVEYGRCIIKKFYLLFKYCIGLWEINNRFGA